MRQLLSNSLRRLVNKPEPSRYARGTREAVVVAVATVKGGVGKTTTAVNLACGLAALRGLRVLLVDLDAQGHCATSLRAHMPSEPVAEAVSEILLAEDRRQLLDAVVSAQVPGLDITPADAGLAEAEGRLGQKIGKELLLRDALSITRTHYDVVIIDCPPNKGNLTLNALLAADQVLVPADLSPLAIQGAAELLETALVVRERLNHPLGVLGVLLTRVDGRTSAMNEAIRGEIREAWDALLLPVEIGVNTQLARAQHEGQHIFAYDPRSRGAQHYEALVDEVIARLRPRA